MPGGCLPSGTCPGTRVFPTARPSLNLANPVGVVTTTACELETQLLYACRVGVSGYTIQDCSEHALSQTRIILAMADSIFHSGDLQSGISLAIQQQKLVACFVRLEDDETSNLWEEQWLVEGGMGDMIKEKAVLLRIEHGSQEAGFLSAFCSITAAPTLVVIHNGQILAQLEGTVSEEEFRERLLSAVGLGTEDGGDEAGENLGGPGVAQPNTQGEVLGTQEPAVPSQMQANTQTPTSRDQTSSEQPSNLQSMFPDRAQRLEAERQRRSEVEAAERRERTARRQQEEAAALSSPITTTNSKGKQRATSPTSTDRTKARSDWIRQQKKRNDEAKRERERILAQIEHDKATRKARDQARKESESEPLGTASTTTTTPQGPFSRAPRPSTRGIGSVCALQIRLFDGKSLKSRFSPTATLSDAVRTYINTQAPSASSTEVTSVAQVPYTFRQILAPEPSRSIEMSEEHQSLLELGLCPSATLVLVPVEGFTEAYASAGGGGVLSRALGASSGLVGGVWGLASSVVGAVAGFGQVGAGNGGGGGGGARDSAPYLGGTGDERDGSNVEGRDMAEGGGEAKQPAGKVRVKTLADQRAEAKRRGEAEFYNGNSLDFESPDEGKKD